MTHNKPIPKLTEAQIARFWNLVDKRSPGECWPWIGALSPDGYGLFEVRYKEDNIKKRQGLKSHRLSYYIETGVDPGALLVCHGDTCLYRKCCNPAHLKTGSHQDNADDLARTRRKAKKTKSRSITIDVIELADGTFSIDLGTIGS